MDQDRFVVFDNQKGVLVPLKQEQNAITEDELNKKAEKLQVLIKAIIKDTVRETTKECFYQFREEWKEHERKEDKRWEEMEKHFRSIDTTIREKQNDSKRKKHSFF